MQNSENNPQYSNPESVETPKPSENGGSSSLNILPSEMKNYLDMLVRQGLGERMIRKAMLQQFPDKAELVDKSENTYRRYINAQKQTSPAKLSTGSNSFTSQPAVAENNREDNQRKSLMELEAHCDERIKRLQDKLAITDDPDLENALCKAIQTKKQLLEMSLEYKDQSVQKTDQEFIEEINDYTQVLLVAVFNVYRMVNGSNSNLDEFHAKLMEFLQETLKYYRVVKLNLHRNCSINIDTKTP
jgi:hypothetical protein